MLDQPMMPVSVMSEGPLSMEDRPARFLCQRPWEQLLLNPNDYYGPCCDLAFHGKRPKSRNDVMELYNSPEMQRVREALLDGTALKTVSRGCSVAGAGGYIPAGHESFYRGKSGVATEAPAEIVAGVSSVCNLRCVMCDSHSGPLVKDLGRDDLRLLEEIGFENLSVVTITGGEPFLTPDSVELLQGLAERDTCHMKIRVITNAQVIGIHLDLVERLRNLHLTVSIDGVGEVYERVRPRARWDRLLKNLNALKVIRDRRRDMILSINTVIMRSTLPCLSDLVDLAIWLDSRVDYQLVREGSCADEEVLGPVPRDEVVAAIDKAIGRVESHWNALGRHGRDMHLNLQGLRAHVDWWWSHRGLPSSAPLREPPPPRKAAAIPGANLIRGADLKDYSNWWINDVRASAPPSAPQLAPIGDYRVVFTHLQPVRLTRGSYVLAMELLARQEQREGPLFACDIQNSEGRTLWAAVDFRKGDSVGGERGFQVYHLTFAVDDDVEAVVRLWNFDNAELLVRSAEVLPMVSTVDDACPDSSNINTTS